LLSKSRDINIIGGGAKSDVWCQILADILDRNINQVQDAKLGGSRGAALIAMVGLGIINDFQEAIPLIKIQKTFKPNPETRNIYDKIYGEYINIYKRNKTMFKALNRI